jgi:hypothetical protein
VPVERLIRSVKRPHGLQTVTVKVLVPVLPDTSVAWQVTVVTPTGNVDPDGGTQVTAGLALPLSSSVAVAVKVTTVPDGPTGFDGPPAATAVNPVPDGVVLTWPQLSSPQVNSEPSPRRATL